jgi:hypothetical protein
VTAPHVRWIFARRLEGFSQAAIARMLNERRVPSPGAYDRIRNPHRQQTVWTLAALLANPRHASRGDHHGPAGITDQPEITCGSVARVPHVRVSGC